MPITTFDPNTLPVGAVLSNSDKTVTYSGGSLVDIASTVTHATGNYVVEFTFEASGSSFNPRCVMDLIGSPQTISRRLFNTTAIVGDAGSSSELNMQVGDTYTIHFNDDNLEISTYHNGVLERGPESYTSFGLEVMPIARVGSNTDSITINGTGPFAIALPAGAEPWDGAPVNEIVSGELDPACLDLSEPYVATLYNAADGTLVASEGIGAGVTSYFVDPAGFVGDYYVTCRPVLTTTSGQILAGSGTLV